MRFAIIGLGRFGMRLARQLYEAGQDVIAVDESLTLIDQIRDHVTLAIAMDATDEAALVANKIDQVDVAIVSIGEDFEAATLATTTLKQLGVARVISRAVTPTIEMIMKRIGADDVVNPEDESADRWATRLVTPHFINQMVIGEKFSAVEIVTPNAWAGKTLVDLNLRQKYFVNIVAIRTKLTPEEKSTQGKGSDDWKTHLPDPNVPLRVGERLIVIGEDEHLGAIPVDQAENGK
ncbi:MAG TPA: TrkA family potassium uptake protein [Phycisphaerales bacterium]|nr:TrkA family potassium uptake protein [Phycisphaerales bacterium]HCD30771.1 TrkA family potassium uptake protein [Phycisphaerales bacterium]|tara:strand:+ start:1627 stop:2331 length:705 start_codon:yes stop_codon:yes gene_type:complete